MAITTYLQFYKTINSAIAAKNRFGVLSMWVYYAVLVWCNKMLMRLKSMVLNINY